LKNGLIRKPRSRSKNIIKPKKSLGSAIIINAGLSIA